MRKLIVFLLFACCATFGQQTNSDIIPATSGLNLGRSNQRWNGYFQNLNINGTCTVNGSPCLGAGSGGNGITITNAGGLSTVPGKQNGTIAVITDGLTSGDCTVGGGITNVVCQFNGFTWSQLPANANFASPPPLGNVTPNTVDATTLTAVGDGLFFQPQSNCIFEGSDPTLHELEDVAGNLMWLPQGLGGPCTQILNYTPPPDGISPTDKQVPAWDAASGQFTIQNQTTSAAIDVRNAGVDCTGATDSSTALNAVFASLSQKEVDFPQDCQIRADHQIVIQGQSAWVIKGKGDRPGTGGFGGPSIYGCNGSAGALLYINRSGYGRIEGIGIYPKGPTGVCGSSSFTQSVQIDSTGNPGVTTHDITLDHVALTSSPAGVAITNYVGISITDGGKQNGEMIKVSNSWIHCQNSSGSIGIFNNNGTSDNDLAEYNHIVSCKYGIESGGNMRIVGNLLSSDGANSVFGAFGASIYTPSCSSGQVNIFYNEADNSGPFIDNGHTGVGSCTNGFNIIGNAIGVSDIASGEYIIDVGGGAGPWNVQGNNFLITQNTSQYIIGSQAQPALKGPLGHLYEFGNNLQSPTLSNTLGWEDITRPFQEGESRSQDTAGTTVPKGPQWGTDLSTTNHLYLTPLIGNNVPNQSPYVGMRSWTGSVADDWMWQTVSIASQSALTFNHVSGPASTLWYNWDGQINGLKVAPLSNPAAPTSVTPTGTPGGTTYTYSIVAYGQSGNTAGSATTSTATGNASLSSTNYNLIQFTPTASIGANRWCVYRTVGGATQGKIGCVNAVVTSATGLSEDVYYLKDTGLTGDASALPAINTTGVIDASLSPFIFLPLSAGYVATAQGNIGYDTTAKNWHVWQNAADRLMAVINGAMVNGNCVKAVVSGSTVSLQDAGVACDAAPAFSAVTPATNTGALVMGSGGSLGTSGTGTITATGLPTTFYAHKFLTGSVGTCVLGTNDDVCIGNAIAQMVGSPGSTGGYGTVDATALGVTGVGNWLANPFASIISNGTTNFTSPQKCGKLLLNAGTQFVEKAPFVIPRCFDVEYVGHRSETQNIIPSADAWWSAPYATGTVTTAAASNPAQGMYQFVVTGSGTTWTTNVVAGEMFSVCQTGGANGAACGGPAATFSNGSAVITATNTLATNQPVQFITTGTLPTNFATKTTYYVISTGLSGSQFEVATTIGGAAIVAGSAGSGTHVFNSYNTCTTACGSATYGMVLAVTDNTHLIVGSNASNHATVNAGGVNYVIWPNLIQLGTMSQTGTDAGGVSATLYGGTFSCQHKAGLGAAIANYSQQEHTLWNSVTINDCINSYVDVEGLVYNSGPYVNTIINASANCNSGTIPVIWRVAGDTREFDAYTINMDVANCAAVHVDDESSTVFSNGHVEDSGTGVTVFSVGQNSGNLPIVICPITCIEPTNSAIGATIEGLTITGTYTNVVLVGSAYSATAALMVTGLQGNAGITNTINDTAINCIVGGSTGDNYVQFYARNSNLNGVLSTAVTPGSTCPIPTFSMYRTASAATNTNIATTTMVNTPNVTGSHQYTLNWYIDLTAVGTNCTGTTTVVINAVFFEPNAAGVQTIPIKTVTLATNSNGTLGYVDGGTFPMYARLNSAVRYSTTSYTAGTGCTVNPTYQVFPTLVQNW